RRWVPPPGQHEDPSPQSRGRRPPHRRQGGPEVRRGWPAPGGDRAGGAQPGRRAVRDRPRRRRAAGTGLVDPRSGVARQQPTLFRLPIAEAPPGGSLSPRGPSTRRVPDLVLEIGREVATIAALEPRD